MENAKALFAQRLREAMIEQGYDPRPAVLEREFNLRYWGKAMTLHGVRRWLRGETLPSQDKLLALADWLHVPPQQLRFGTEIDVKIRERRTRWDAAMGYQDREMMEAYLRIPSTQRKALREVIMAVARAYAVEGGGGAETIRISLTGIACVASDEKVGSATLEPTYSESIAIGVP